jgi:hypothetical protein
MIGETPAHWEITAQPGKGGMGEVHGAKDPTLGREVAIRVLPEEQCAKEANFSAGQFHTLTPILRIKEKITISPRRT